ncbi:MAG: flagellar biosynthesis protein FliQ [Betaproteobacteria bacterium]|jgi:flagellar biosynthetic protein FliQ
MSPESVMNIGRNAMETAIMVAGPFLAVALIVGLIVSIFQAATQINEATLAFIPKLLAVMLTLFLLGPWVSSIMIDYMRQVLTNLPALVS